MNCCMINEDRCLLFGSEIKIYNVRELRYKLLQQLDQLAEIGIRKFVIRTTSMFDKLSRQVLEMLKVVYPDICVEDCADKESLQLEKYPNCKYIICYVDLFGSNELVASIINDLSISGRYMINLYNE